VRNEEVLLKVKEQRNILHEISKRKANWIGHIKVYLKKVGWEGVDCINLAQDRVKRHGVYI
jgi:hypothetical protein